MDSWHRAAQTSRGKSRYFLFLFFFRYFLKEEPCRPRTLGTQGPRSLRSPRGQQVAVLPTPTGRSRAPPAGDSRRCGFLQVHVEATLPAMPAVAGDPEAERKAGPSSVCATSQPPRVPSGQSGKQLLGCLSEHGVGGTPPLQPSKLPVRETGASDHGGAWGWGIGSWFIQYTFFFLSAFVAKDKSTIRKEEPHFQQRGVFNHWKVLLIKRMENLYETQKASF